MEDQGEDSDFSCKDIDETNAALEEMNKTAKPSRPNLLTYLSAYKQQQQPVPSSKPASSQSSMPDRETLANLEEDVANLPEDGDQHSACPLCQEPVDEEHSVEFWKAHNRTVRNQSLFCKEHNIRTAQKRYEQGGFPKIDWEALPSRISRLRPQLLNLLRNQTGAKESKYRKQHAAKLLSGKAAVVPTKRKGKNIEEVERQLETFDDDIAPSTGYYGPRGRRLMMETITAELSDTIREVSTTDPVVGRSGFAVYIQAVLVPELTVLLVREDFDVSEGMAEELIEQSSDLGALLHEEVEDKVEVGSSDEDEEREVLELDDDGKYEAIEEIDMVKDTRGRRNRKAKKGDGGGV